MAGGSCVFELACKPKPGRYVAFMASVCAGFWFFDFFVRGWLGGTPNLAVSLRHTFIIAVCLGFAGGFLLRDRRQSLTLSQEGIAFQEAGRRHVQLAWEDVSGASIKGGLIACQGRGSAFSIPLETLDLASFLSCLETLAGPEHVLTSVAREAVQSAGLP